MSQLILSVLISDPVVEKSSIKSFATYRIASKLLYKPPGDERVEREGIVVTRRRFKEFILLQESLRSTNPGIILPPLPPATLHVYPSREFVEKRQVLLQRYLDNITCHHVLQRDPIFWAFLQSEDFQRAISDMHLPDKKFDLASRSSLLQDNIRHPDPLEMRLEYLQRITTRLEILKISLVEYFAAKQNLANRITDLGRSFIGYLDATTDHGQHSKLVQFIDSLNAISELIALETEQAIDAKGFIIIVDDYLRMAQEAEQAFGLKRTLKSLVYTLKVTLIDLQATLIKSQTEKRRSFDRNYNLSEKFLNKREEFKKASETYEEICQKLNAELDRIDCRRMIELEQCLNRSLKNLLDAQTQIIEIWETFLTSNESVISLNASELASLSSPTFVF